MIILVTQATEVQFDFNSINILELAEALGISVLLSLITSANFLKIGSTRDNVMNKVYVDGGGPQFIAALQSMQFDNPERNWEMYSNWADSITSFPKVIKQKVRGSKRSSMNFKSLNSMLDLLCMDFRVSNYQTIQPSIPL